MRVRKIHTCEPKFVNASQNLEMRANIDKCDSKISFRFRYFQTGFSVALKCRPVLMETPADISSNIGDLGHIVFEMIRNTVKEKNYGWFICCFQCMGQITERLDWRLDEYRKHQCNCVFQTSLHLERRKTCTATHQPLRPWTSFIQF